MSLWFFHHNGKVNEDSKSSQIRIEINSLSVAEFISIGVKENINIKYNNSKCNFSTLEFFIYPKFGIAFEKGVVALFV